MRRSAGALRCSARECGSSARAAGPLLAAIGGCVYSGRRGRDVSLRSGNKTTESDRPFAEMRSQVNVAHRAFQKLPSNLFTEFEDHSFSELRELKAF